MEIIIAQLMWVRSIFIMIPYSLFIHLQTPIDADVPLKHSLSGTLEASPQRSAATCSTYAATKPSLQTAGSIQQSTAAVQSPT